ncbi:MAG: hypothetical protein JW840_00175, partial [Candidatus Thermoplasmatota archaeon]|nr:hypothetical protein [Candidatus Thermoplasmatota archaeon]
MRGKNCFRKTWVVCIFVLLVGTAITPVMSGFLSERDFKDVQPFDTGSRGKNDTIPPMTTISFDPPSPNGNGGWYVSNVTVTLNATDNESGVNWTYCSLSSGGIYTGPILVSQSGQYHVTFYSVDYAGNIESMKNVSLKIEKAPPGPSTVSISTDGKNICITVTVCDLLSGCGKVEFYFNDVLQETVVGVGPDYTWCFEYDHLSFFSIKVIIYYLSGNVAIFEIVFGP